MVCHRRKRAVDRKLREVCADPVPLGVRIGKGAALQHFIGGKFDAGNDICGAEGCLFNIREKVFRIFIDGQHSDLHKRELIFRPDLRIVQRVEGKRFGDSGIHELHAEFIAERIAGSDARMEIANGDVGIEPALAAVDHVPRFLPEEMVFHEPAPAFLIDPDEGIYAKAVHSGIVFYDAPVAVKPHELVQAFRGQGEKVPDVPVIFNIGARIGLLGMDEVGELDRVADEKDREA